MSRKQPAALMSYARSDDTDRSLTLFRERLSQEVHVQTGSEFPIFQDINDIQLGESWQQRIDDSLDEVTFLIPIITPTFFNREACRAELERFLDRENTLGRNDLILPIYFVDTPLINDPELRATDELAEVIWSRQYFDWRELRFETLTNPQVRKAMAQLAVQIRDALPRVQITKRARPKSSAGRKARPAAATTAAGGEQPTENPTAKKQPPICIVDQKGGGEFVTISEAIQNVEPGTRILIRPGLYQEGLIVNKPLEIIGDGKQGEVIIQMAGMSVFQFQTTMGRLVNLSLQQMAGGKWYCVDIPQGRLDMEDCQITSQSVACVAIYGDADPRLRRNSIHNSKDGTGVFFFENAQGTLEDNDIYGHALAGLEIKERADPTVRHNRIHDSKGGGVYVHEGGQGTLEDNDIFGNDLSAVAIKTTGNPILLRNRIYDSKWGSGVYVSQGGQGRLEDNQIFNNAYAGVTSRSDSNPVVRKNHIHKNGEFGVKVFENGGGTFEDNDLTDNVKGAWFIADDSEPKVTRVNNKE